ncbi:MAG: hypothetical protein ACT4PU_07195 [Planctomycetota bacterium]
MNPCRSLAVALLLLPLLQACAALPADERFDHDLAAGIAVEGEIHGAYPELGQYVFTYRIPGNFFEFVQVSLVAANEEVASTLAGLRRHDRVRIRGTLLENPSAQRHVELDSIELVKSFNPTPPVGRYDYATSVPQDLVGREEGVFLVHAVQAGGRVLVLELGDIVLPVHIERPELTRDLARNDVVRVAYEIRRRPEGTAHLQLKNVERPIEVVEAVMDLHGEPASVEGALVLFPKSPQLLFNTFAVLQELPGGLRRQFTLANFEDPQAFLAIRDKLQQAWDAAGVEGAVSGRNKLVSTTVRVRATGLFNQVDQNQANVQILLDGPDAIEVASG